MRAGWRLLGQSILFLILFLGFGILAMFIPGANLSGFSLFSQSLSFLAITISVFAARWLLDRKPIAGLGLAINRQAVLDLFMGLVISSLMMGFIFIIEWAAGWLRIEGFSWDETSIWQIIPQVLVMLVFYIMVGWQEELSSRGYQLQNLAEGLNLFWAVVISSVGFALLHLANPSVSWMAILGLVVSGLFLAYGYVATRQLWLSIGLHIGWNFVEGTVLGFQVSGYSGMPRLILQSVNGNSYFTGGEFGPEAGLVLLPGILLGVLLIFFYTRNRNKKISYP